MKNNKLYITLIASLIAFISTGCLEEFDFKTETFESAIVIEGTITNELKNQEILVSRTFRFEEEGPTAEANADVRIVDDLSNTYNFQESTPGKYVSVNQFSALPNVNYQLLITTSDGRTYESTPTQLTNASQLDDVNVNRITNNDGVDGIEITVNSFDPTGNSKYYRYTYEETYKIVAPKWTQLDFLVISDTPPFEVGTQTRTQEEKTCYGTNTSNTIIITDTNDLNEDRVSDFPVRFIASDNYIIGHRYSILVHQFIQSQQAYNFYKTLRDLSGSESIFSQNQPGFFNGNIASTTNPDEKVVGYFDVATVTSQRIFFNFQDYYPGVEAPFISNCTEFSPELTSPAMPPSSPLIDQIQLGTIKYFSDNDNPGEGEGPYYAVSRQCGDCTALGSNVVPPFWVE